MRSGIARLLAGESIASVARGRAGAGGRGAAGRVAPRSVAAGSVPTAGVVPSAGARDQSVPARVPPEEIDGAVLEQIERHRVCVIRRPVRELLPGADLEGELRRGLESLAGRDPDSIYAGLRPAIGQSLEDIVVLDLETTGFWGCPIFLVGMILWDGGELTSVQILARDYPEELAMLAASVTFLRSRRLMVTFNGKSYDIPCFRERCEFHRVPSSVHQIEHVDVLHASRRRWKDELPDCRLQTLEWEIVGLRRTGDVPSAEIPGVYHEFVATGDPWPLQPVLHHGRVDTVTTASLFARLLADPPTPIGARTRSTKPGAASRSTVSRSAVSRSAVSRSAVD